PRVISIDPVPLAFQERLLIIIVSFLSAFHQRSLKLFWSHRLDRVDNLLLGRVSGPVKSKAVLLGDLAQGTPVPIAARDEVIVSSFTSLWRSESAWNSRSRLSHGSIQRARVGIWIKRTHRSAPLS